MTTCRRILAVLVSLAGLLAAAGCEGADRAPAPAPADTTSEAASAWTAGIVEEQDAGAGVARLDTVRTARHPAFDRVVFVFREQVPGYHLEYVDRPVRRCGSGQPVPLAGEGWLQVRFRPARAHTEAGAATIAERSRAPNLPVLKELELTCDFEADVTWVLGLAAPNPYRVARLEHPPRLVVDVRH